MSFDLACKLFVKGLRQLRLWLVINYTLTKSVVVMANKSVDTSVSLQTSYLSLQLISTQNKTQWSRTDP